MLEIANREILPAGMKFAKSVANGMNAVIKTGIDADTSAQADVLVEISSLNAKCKKAINELQTAVNKTSSYQKIDAKADAYRDDVFIKMGELRIVADQMEIICDDEIWPLPSCGELLFNI